MSLSGKSILLTGASGFIGAALSRRLRDAGALVHGVSRSARAGGGCSRWWQVDLNDFAEVSRVLDAARPDIIFHLAGLVSGTRELAAVLPMLQANLVAAANLLVASTERRVGRLVFAGSLEEPQPNAAWSVPSSPYAAAKFCAGAYMRMCHALYGTPAVWLRLFMVYGPAQTDVRKLIPYVTLSLLRGEAPALSDGTRRVDWIYIDDVVDALLAAALAAGIEGQTIDVGSGRLVPVRTVVEQIVQLVNPAISPRFGALPARAFEQVRVADTAAAESYLGVRARTPLDEGLRNTVEWYAKHHVTE